MCKCLELEVMKNYVLVPREDYDKLITLKTIADDAVEAIVPITKKCDVVSNLLKKKALQGDGNTTILDLLFKKGRMGTDSRAEQCDLNSPYFGFEQHARKYLNELGITDNDLLIYINIQWDVREGK